jgi:signal transduction histidine kinase
MEGTNLTHCHSPSLICKNLMNLKDADGKLFVKERIDILKTHAGRTIEYDGPITRPIR